ncbi:hypothetical protein ACIF6L_34830 [Kitasatospora sp. NPDC086009]|uniref:hypothetical protein n=1 Tax=unclassified Kitasatospora TaxID=2633591 RepID=UPI0037C60267
MLDIYPIPTRTDADSIEISRLSHEHVRLRRLPADARTHPLYGDRLTRVTRRLLVLMERPPAGYTLPRAAADLLACAYLSGWDSQHAWTVEPGVEPHVKVIVRRVLTREEAAERRMDRWTYELCWHSRGCAPGRVRLFGQITARTPDSPVIHTVASIRHVRRAILSNSIPAGS